MSIILNLQPGVIKIDVSLLKGCSIPLSSDAKTLALSLLKDQNTSKREKYTDKQLHKTFFYRDSDISKTKTLSTNDYSTIRKPELKRILDERGVSYNSGDPVVLLRQMCMESDPNNDPSK